ncbi:hypothetical protein Acsp01_44560 [Actinoplanes sp. NBRC 101535]|nr:hypothetical protein Acsp01_44560 [Actinoplanes sp. NBRC 101535]
MNSIAGLFEPAVAGGAAGDDRRGHPGHGRRVRHHRPACRRRGLRADLTALGRPFLANPDLVERLRTGAPVNQVRNRHLMYVGGETGYTDYPALPSGPSAPSAVSA